jgi:hypothetical protein
MYLSQLAVEATRPAPRLWQIQCPGSQTVEGQQPLRASSEECCPAPEGSLVLFKLTYRPAESRRKRTVTNAGDTVAPQELSATMGGTRNGVATLKQPGGLL